MKPRLIEEYVATGRVRLEYRDYAFLGEESTRAAEAAACAADQGGFWPYHDALFANQRGREEGAFAGGRLRETARLLELDEDAFVRCLDGGTHRSEIAAMRGEARALGIDSTPTVVVNGRVVPIGDYADLAGAIEAELTR